ncbi:MAG: hypothetical protein AB1635_02080 [Acidobacteriota bacterium]
MTSSDLSQLIREFYLERVALLMRHENTATIVTPYDINNAYQYVIAREETHLSWLQHALVDLGTEIPADPPRPAAPPRAKGAWAAEAAEDARLQRAFVERWRPRVEAVTHARHKAMLKIVLGEMLEHERIFAQAAAGRTDLIGTHLAINERRGDVLPTRWVE